MPNKVNRETLRKKQWKANRATGLDMGGHDHTLATQPHGGRGLALTFGDLAYLERMRERPAYREFLAGLAEDRP